MELEELRLFLRIDGTEEDALIKGLQLAAEEYLLNSGIKKAYTNELYKLAIKLLISHWYENRNIVVIGTISKEMEFSLRAILVQLKYCGEVTIQ